LTYADNTREHKEQADVNCNAEHNDSQAQVLACVRVAIEKVDKVEAGAKKKIDKVEAGAKKAKCQIEAQAKKAKSQIVQELARDLEGKIPTDEISSEIIHQLHGRVSQRLIHDCLDEKYKKKHRVENAQKQKKNQEQDSAALNKPVPLNSKIVINTSGEQTVEPAAETRHPDRSAKTGIDAEASQSRFDDDEEGTTNTESKEESTVTSSFNDEVLVSHIPMSFEELRKDMETVFRITKGVGNVFFKVWVDLGTYVIKIEFCGITQHKDVAMISIGKGELKETS
jgi:hypothetical protein